MAESRVKAQMMHNSLAGRDGELSPHLFTVTAEGSANFAINTRLQIYVHYNGARMKLWIKAVVMEDGKTPPTSVFVGHGYLQHAESE